MALRGELPGNVEGQHELSEVDGPAPVGVEGSEDDLTELVSAASREYPVVHLHKLSLGQLAVGTVLHKANMPFLRSDYSINTKLSSRTLSKQNIKIFINRNSTSDQTYRAQSPSASHGTKEAVGVGCNASSKLIFLMSSHQGFAVCDLKLTFSSGSSMFS